MKKKKTIASKWHNKYLFHRLESVSLIPANAYGELLLIAKEQNWLCRLGGEEWHKLCLLSITETSKLWTSVSSCMQKRADGTFLPNWGEAGGGVDHEPEMSPCLIFVSDEQLVEEQIVNCRREIGILHSVCNSVSFSELL